MVRDYQFVVDALGADQTKALAAMAIPTLGVQQSSLTPGELKIFKPYLVECALRPGWFYLKPGYFRQAVQVSVVDTVSSPEGSLNFRRGSSLGGSLNFRLAFLCAAF